MWNTTDSIHILYDIICGTLQTPYMYYMMHNVDVGPGIMIYDGFDIICTDAK